MKLLLIQIWPISGELFEAQSTLSWGPALLRAGIPGFQGGVQWVQYFNIVELCWTNDFQEHPDWQGTQVSILLGA